MNRRGFLCTTTLSTLALAGCGSNTTATMSDSSMSISTTSAINTNTQSKLFIPPEIVATLNNGIYEYNMNIQSGTTEFISGIKTPTYGINNSYLGSTIRLVNGQKVKINFKNNLNESTTMHEHGIHLPAKMDGGPAQVIKSKETWSAQYTVNQKASTCWYHSHLMHKTGEQVIKGLAGLIIIDDIESKTLDLPKQYGVDDIPLIVQDRSFNSDGSFNYSLSNMQRMHGYDGDTLLINGWNVPYKLDNY